MVTVWHLGWGPISTRVSMIPVTTGRECDRLCTTVLGSDLSHCHILFVQTCPMAILYLASEQNRERDVAPSSNQEKRKEDWGFLWIRPTILRKGHSFSFMPNSVEMGRNDSILYVCCERLIVIFLYLNYLGVTLTNKSLEFGRGTQGKSNHADCFLLNNMLGQLSMSAKITEHRRGDAESILTCFRLHWKVGLSLQDAIDNFSTVPIRWVISIRCSDLDDKRACNDRKVTENNLVHVHMKKAWS